MERDERRWDDGLSDPPRDVAAADASPLRLRLVQGTGKSFALKRRVARRLQEGTPPDRILAVTFTRMAANDLQKELAALGIEGSDKVDAGTLHALCFRVLTRADVLESTHRSPRALLDFETRLMIEDLNGGGFGGIRDRQRRLQAFNAAWARLQSDEPGWPGDETDRDFHEALLAWLRFHRAMLVGELVPVTLTYLRNNPESLFRGAYDHAFLDEYQDLNKTEQELADLLAKNGTRSLVTRTSPSTHSSARIQTAFGRSSALRRSCSRSVAAAPCGSSIWLTH